jgi:hypothetical protein
MRFFSVYVFGLSYLPSMNGNLFSATVPEIAPAEINFLLEIDFVSFLFNQYVKSNETNANR